MIRCDDSITIDRAPADVFAFVADPSNIPQWQGAVVKSTVLTPGPTRVGTRYTEEIRMGTMQMTATCEVIDFVPGSVIGFTARSTAIDYQGRISVESWQSRSKLSMAGTARLRGWRKLMQPLMQSQFRKTLKQELVAAKTVLEAEQTAPERKIARPA